MKDVFAGRYTIEELNFISAMTDNKGYTLPSGCRIVNQDGDLKLFVPDDILDGINTMAKYKHLIPEGTECLPPVEDDMPTYIVNRDGHLDVRFHKVGNRRIITIDAAPNLQELMDETAANKRLQAQRTVEDFQSNRSFGVTKVAPCASDVAPEAAKKAAELLLEDPDLSSSERSNLRNVIGEAIEMIEERAAHRENVEHQIKNVSGMSNSEIQDAFSSAEVGDQFVTGDEPSNIGAVAVTAKLGDDGNVEDLIVEDPKKVFVPSDTGDAPTAGDPNIPQEIRDATIYVNFEEFLNATEKRQVCNIVLDIARQAQAIGSDILTIQDTSHKEDENVEGNE